VVRSLCPISRSVPSAVQRQGKCEALRYYWERLLAHRHWFAVPVFGRELHLCSRCSGIVLGFAGLKFSLIAVSASYAFPFSSGFLVSLLLALPSILDWTTQSLGFRQSSNGLRFATGFLEGVGVAFLGLLEISALLRLLVLAGIGLGVLCAGFFGRMLAWPSKTVCNCS